MPPGFMGAHGEDEEHEEEDDDGLGDLEGDEDDEGDEGEEDEHEHDGEEGGEMVDEEDDGEGRPGPRRGRAHQRACENNFGKGRLRIIYLRAELEPARQQQHIISRQDHIANCVPLKFDIHHLYMLHRFLTIGPRLSAAADAAWAQDALADAGGAVPAGGGGVRMVPHVAAPMDLVDGMAEDDGEDEEGQEDDGGEGEEDEGGEMDENSEGEEEEGMYDDDEMALAEADVHGGHRLIPRGNRLLLAGKGSSC